MAGNLQLQPRRVQFLICLLDLYPNSEFQSIHNGSICINATVFNMIFFQKLEKLI